MASKMKMAEMLHLKVFPFRNTWSNVDFLFIGDVSSTKSLLEIHEESVSVMVQSTESFLSESPLHLAISQVLP